MSRDPAPAVPPPDAHEELGAALRALLDRVMSTAAPAAQLREITAEIEDLDARLAAAPAAPSLLRQGALAHGMSLVGGRAHPAAPQMEVMTTDTGIVASVVVGPVFEGAPGLVHGGVVSLLFDHALSHAVVAEGHGGMTGSLTVRYTAPTPLNVALRITARVDRVEGRKVFASGEIGADGLVCAEADAVFVVLTEAHVAAMFPSPAGAGA